LGRLLNSKSKGTKFGIIYPDNIAIINYLASNDTDFQELMDVAGDVRSDIESLAFPKCNLEIIPPGFGEAKALVRQSRTVQLVTSSGGVKVVPPKHLLNMWDISGFPICWADLKNYIKHEIRERPHPSVARPVSDQIIKRITEQIRTVIILRFSKVVTTNQEDEWEEGIRKIYKGLINPENGRLRIFEEIEEAKEIVAAEEEKAIERRRNVKAKQRKRAEAAAKRIEEKRKAAETRMAAAEKRRTAAEENKFTLTQKRAVVANAAARAGRKRIAEAEAIKKAKAKEEERRVKAAKAAATRRAEAATRRAAAAAIQENFEERWNKLKISLDKEENLKRAKQLIEEIGEQQREETKSTGKQKTRPSWMGKLMSTIIAALKTEEKKRQEAAAAEAAKAEIKKEAEIRRPEAAEAVEAEAAAEIEAIVKREAAEKPKKIPKAKKNEIMTIIRQLASVQKVRKGTRSPKKTSATSKKGKNKSKEQMEQQVDNIVTLLNSLSQNEETVSKTKSKRVDSRYTRPAVTKGDNKVESISKLLGEITNLSKKPVTERIEKLVIENARRKGITRHAEEDSIKHMIRVLMVINKVSKDNIRRKTGERKGGKTGERKGGKTGEMILDFDFNDLTERNKKEVINTYITMLRKFGIDPEDDFLAKLNNMNIENLTGQIRGLHGSFNTSK
jgi:hypothetical protein